MIRHILNVLGGNKLRPEVNDFQVMHIFYRLDTEDFDPETNTVLSYATTGNKMLGLDDWDIENKIPGENVTNEILEQWLSAKINLDQLKENNVSNLKPLPK